LVGESGLDLVHDFGVGGIPLMFAWLIIPEIHG
jgi:hypothetical protein